jgi:Zn-dependent alcohol dehydrogenase
MNGELMLDEFVTHTMELDKVNEAYDMLIKGKR